LSATATADAHLTHQVADCPTVAAEILAGDGLTLAQAARRLPGRQGKLSPSTFFLWATTGVLVNGQRVRLEVARIGCRWLTSQQALARFAAALNGQSTTTTDTPPTKTQARRRREIDAAQYELKRKGI
jgi:hypothetical protein